MYQIVSTDPIKNYFHSEDRLGYIQTQELFFMEARVSREDICTPNMKLILWMYAHYTTNPIYYAVMSDRFYYKKIDNDKFLKYTMFKKIPHYIDNWKKEREPSHIPLEQRIIKNINDTDEFVKPLIKNNYNKQDYVEIIIE